MRKIISLLFLLPVIIACDSGDIYPDEPDIPVNGITIRATFHFDETGAFPDDYQLILGVFDDEKVNPVSSVRILKPKGGNPVEVSISNIPQHATTVKLCLREPGKGPAYVFFQESIVGVKEDISFGDQSVNLVEYSRVQQMVFNEYQCLSCHGSGQGAGRLLLNSGSSYANLVNKASTKYPEMFRVKPYDAENSFLIHALMDESSGLSTPHTGFVYREDDLKLLQEWINAGAERK